jgi:hypothetical protein
LKRYLLFFTTTFLVVACRKAEPPKPRTEPWENPAYGTSSSAVASASPSPSAGRKFALDPASSRITFSLPAKGGTPRGSLHEASGTLDFNAANPAASQAELSFDLASIVLDAASDSPAGATAALDWLELGAEVASATREQHRRATFALSKLSGFGEGLEKPHGKAFGSARGELSLHGFRVPLEVSLEIERRGDELVVRTRKPASIKLAEHDIVPRGPAGERRSQDLALLGATVGKEIKVECELAFRPVAK